MNGPIPTMAFMFRATHSVRPRARSSFSDGRGVGIESQTVCGNLFPAVIPFTVNVLGEPNEVRNPSSLCADKQRDSSAPSAPRNDDLAHFSANGECGQSISGLSLFWLRVPHTLRFFKGRGFGF